MTNMSISAPEDEHDTPGETRLDDRARILQAFASIGDIEVPLSAEVDRLKISVRELLRWKLGQTISLNRPTGENIDLFVGEVLLANAEILIVEDKLAVRVADLKGKAPTVKEPAAG